MSAELTDRLGEHPTGTFEMWVREGGAVIEHVHEPNLVVGGIREVIARLLGGTSAKAITHLGVGTNGTPPVVGDAVLANAVLVTISGVTYPQAGHVRFAWQVGTGVANGLQIREFGLLNPDGTLVARKVRSAAIDKTNQISIEGQWTLHF